MLKELRPLIIDGVSLRSRLLVGTGKFSSPSVMVSAVEASGAEVVTVALRRVDLDNPGDRLLGAFESDKYRLLPNTSGARDAVEAVRLAKLGRAVCRTQWVKLEVTPDPVTLLPDPCETLEAAKQLVKLGFVVLPYIPADPILALRLEEIGCATVMPLGAPIGTNRGLLTRDMVRLIAERASVPVIVDAGLGVPSHVAEAFELGADGVLVNTAIAAAHNPVRMARAFRLAVESSVEAREAGRATQSEAARASSPLTGFLD